MTAARAARFRWRWRWPRTLSRQLMLGVSALVTVVVLAVGTLSVLTLRSYVNAVSDVEVRHSLTAFQQSLAEDPGATDDDRLTDFTGQAAGTIIAILRDGQVVQSAMFSDTKARPAPAEASGVLRTLDWSGAEPRNVDLGALGRYRVSSADVGNGERLISAVSLREADSVIAKKTTAVIAITLVAALLAAAGTVALVRKALWPLRRVAATAAKAATLPLADDGHRITTRVRSVDSDPDHEVGIVGETLNRLLANVDSALAARAESDRRMRRFLTDASHELRTPLAAIRGYAELTRQDGPMLPETTEYALARIESESRRMTSLVDDLLLLSRLDERRGLQLELLDLCVLVVDAINDVAVTAPEHTFSADLPDDPVWVWGDHARLHQVVSNLLANARDHTPAGVTVTTTIRVPPETTSGAIELTVSDDGPGIDEALVPELFGRFVRADKARSRELNNSGLGLAIVASIAEAHGGTASVTSQSGATEFLVCLPAAELDDQHGIAKSYEPDMNSSTSPVSVDMLDIR